MNLGELRLKALQSLKRPYNTTTTNSSTTTMTNSKEPDNKNCKLETVEVSEVVDGKEEGEITDLEVEESSSSSSSGEEEDNFNFHKYKNVKNNASRRYSKNNRKVVPVYKPSDNITSSRRNTTWTRKTGNDLFTEDLDDVDDTEDEKYIKLGLDQLINEKDRILELLDENQSLLAAYEDKEHDLLEQLKESRALKKSCAREQFKLDCKLEKLRGQISKRDNIEDEARKQVCSTNFKKQFVGELLKGSYCRSLKDFQSSDLCKLYCDTLSIKPIDFGGRAVSDVNQPICLTELQKGKCKYRDKGTCSLQHLKL